MSEKEFLVDAVAQFLQTQAWQDALNEFFLDHHSKFEDDPAESVDKKQSKGIGHTLEQYDIFMKFKDLAERLLESVMRDLGCSGEDLVALLQESLQKGPTGERRFLIKTLLSFEDFEEFHARIVEFGSRERITMTEETTGEMTDWQMQLAVAQSLIEAHARGLLDENEQSFLPWAKALLGMSTSTEEEAKEVSEDKNAASAAHDEPTGAEHDERLKTLESTLILERLKVDLLVVQRIADANAALKKEMLHLTASELDQGDEWSNERDLDGLFAALETARDRVKVVKAKCFEFKNVAQEAMDQMYLYLKEKVHFQQDLVAQEKEIAEFIFSHIHQADAALVPLLLEWLLLESEAHRTQYQIQEHLGEISSSGGGVGDEGYWTQSWDEGAQAFYYFHSVTGESVWEAPACGYYDVNQDFLIPDEAAREAESTDAASEAVTSQEAVELHDMINASSIPSTEDVLAMDKVLEKISREHDDERARLELVFEVEKARQKEELRRRKESKRRAKLAKKKKAQEESDAAESKASDSDQLDYAAKPAKTPRQLVSAVEGSDNTDAKTEPELGGLALRVPGRGPIDLAHLLSETHAKRQLDKRGLIMAQPPAPQALLNPSSLRFIAESLAKKDPVGWINASPRSARGTAPVELVLEEADEK